MAPQQSAKFWTAFLANFEEGYRRQCMDCRCFRRLSEGTFYSGTLKCTKHFLTSVGRWRHKIRKIVVEILQNVNNQTQTLRQILRMATTEIVTLLPVDWHYILPVGIVSGGGTMFLVSSLDTDPSCPSSVAFSYVVPRTTIQYRWRQVNSFDVVQPRIWSKSVCRRPFRFFFKRLFLFCRSGIEAAALSDVWILGADLLTYLLTSFCREPFWFWHIFI